MNKIRNIILIGKTGAGKSTLGNLLVNKNGKFEDVFKTSAGSVSETKKYQGEELETDGIKYRIVDTIGLGDTKLMTKEVFFELADAIRNYFKDDGINQVLFVIDGRFTQEDLQDLAVLKVVIFDEELAKFTTIVRTRFPEFDDQGACDEDIQALRDENPELNSLISSISPNNIIHTDAPEKNYEGWEED